MTSQFLVNGGLMYLNEFQIDGSPNDAQLGGNTYGYSPPNYAVKEFSVNANSYDAQYGHTSGGVINLGTVSGTDKVHGMAWDFFRRPGWNANSFQNNAIGAKRPPSSRIDFVDAINSSTVLNVRYGYTLYRECRRCLRLTAPMNCQLAVAAL